jgi:Protein of unknown function (DUF2961)
VFDDPARIDSALDSRSISFENPTGERGAGGAAANGRKGSPSRLIGAGETVTLADIKGPGRLRHLWMTFPPGPPAQMRSLVLQVFYDGLDEPSIAVPCLDFFGLPHGRPAAYSSALTSVAEGRGFNAYFPMPFRKRLRMDIVNASPVPIAFFYQIDYTLGDVPADAGYLHVSFRRENPTTERRDFVIAGGFRGPGRFLGSVVGIRVLSDDMSWYGEGEFKFYRDGDRTHPTICGTGLEDYVGSAWGMGPHISPFAGVPIHLVPPASKPPLLGPVPEFVSFYRWHVPDPIVFRSAFTATIQQIGALAVARGRESEVAVLTKKYTLAGNGWARDIQGAPFSAFALAERRDDYCAAAFVYCRSPQPVARVDVRAATADIERRAYERAPARPAD